MSETTPKVWHNGVDWFVAADREQLARLVWSFYETKLEDLGDGWEILPDTETIRITYPDAPKEGPHALEMTAAEWAAYNGAGFLGSLEW